MTGITAAGHLALCARDANRVGAPVAVATREAAGARGIECNLVVARLLALQRHRTVGARRTGVVNHRHRGGCTEVGIAHGVEARGRTLEIGRTITERILADRTLGTQARARAIGSLWWAREIVDLAVGAAVVVGLVAHDGLCHHAANHERRHQQAHRMHHQEGCGRNVRTDALKIATQIICGPTPTMDNPMHDEMVRRVLEISLTMTPAHDIAPILDVPPVSIHWLCTPQPDSLN